MQNFQRTYSIYYFMPRKFVHLFLVGYQIVNATFWKPNESI